MNDSTGSNKRKYFAVGKYEKEIVNTFFLFACLPLVVSIGALYWFFSQFVDPHLVNSPFKQNVEVFITIAIIFFAYYFIVIGIIAYHLANRFVGAIPRVISEIDRVLSGAHKTRIAVRRGDRLTELIDRINSLIEKLP